MITDQHQIDFEKLFNILPERYFIVSAVEPYTFLTANAAYCELTKKSLPKLVGKALFDVFPDTSPRAIKTGKGELQHSIENCIITKQPDHMGIIRYDLADEKGRYQVRYWQATHFPLIGDDGNVYAVLQSTAEVTDMVLANERVELSELQLDDILSAGLIGSWIWDIKENKVVADKGLATMFGMEQSKAITGLPLATFVGAIHSDDRTRVESEIEEAVQVSDQFESEYRVVDRDGAVRWVIARGHIERGIDGRALRLPGVMLDITARRQAEDALAESEQQLRFMANSMPQLVWVSRPDGYHEYYNQQWYEYTGTKQGSTDGEGWSELFHVDDRHHARKVWKHSLKTGEPYEIEYRLYHAPTKSYRWVIGRALPYRDESGEIIKWYGTCTDIDQQKRASKIQTFLSEASKELSESLDYIKTLDKVTKLCVPEIADWCSVDLYDEEKGWDQVSVAHVDPEKVNLAREYRRVNPIHVDDPGGVPKVMRTGEIEYYPYIDNELIKQYMEPGENRDFMISLNLHALIIAPLTIRGKGVGAISFVSSDSGRNYTDTDLEMAKELASRISLTITNARLYDDSLNEIARREQLEAELISEKETLESRVQERTQQLQETNEGLRQEIKKRHLAERELKEKSKNLTRSNQELQDFAYVASHDLQEPLRKIQAFGNLLESEYGPTLGEGADYLARMRSAASRMSVLIEDLLAFSRVTTKAKESVPIELSAIMADVVSDLESRIKDTGGTVEIGNLPIIKADPTHMRQLFQNLIGNALKFHRPDVPPVVTVSSRMLDDDGEKYEIKVMDNGIGFDEKYLDRIFSVFQRLHGRDEYEGTGIGLAVCRKIVERYGGTITAESKKDAGSTFIIVLPQRIRE
jgi:PAS domain S-box-containing protein